MEQNNSKKSFKEGYKKNNVIIFLAAAVLAIALTYGIEQSFLHGGITIFDRGYFLKSEKDLKTNITFDMYEVMYPKNQDVDTNVYVIGGSSTREAIISEEHLENALNETYNLNTNVEILVINLMSIMDILQIVDNLPAEEGGVVVLGLSSRNVTQREFFNNIHIHSDIYVDYMYNNEYVQNIHRTTQEKIKLYSTDYFMQYAAAVSKNPPIVFTNKEIKWHSYEPYTHEEDMEEYVSCEIMRQSNVTTEDVDFFNKLMYEIIRICDEKGFEVVIWDTPYNTDMTGDVIFESVNKFTYYYETIDKLIENTDVYYLDYVKDLDIPIDEFYDVVHISTDNARLMVEEGLIYHLNEIINNVDMGE